MGMTRVAWQCAVPDRADPTPRQDPLFGWVPRRIPAGTILSIL